MIPAKNEAKLIPRLLNSLTNQDYSKMPNTRVLVADANSTDGTPEVVKQFRHLLKVRIIPGGLPSFGRNAGAGLAATPYVLFLDADIELASPSLIRRALELAQSKKLHCVTTNILCRDGGFTDRLLYAGNDCFQHLSRWHRPFSTGMFMLFDKQRFEELGGFDVRIQFAEDYHLSKQVARKRFGIVRGGVYTTNRRFQKMGHARVARLFLATAFNFWNQGYFLRDHKYWESEASAPPLSPQK
ncbi:MAG TPA: glycosyltransferase family A protein [Terriglobales bacterium]|nr:glycosyltransferase family A protein [Terriglobales bacterium]